MYPHPDLEGGKSITDIDVKDVRLELDLSRAGVRNQYAIKSALPNKIHVFVVGCGGNGGYIVPQVARYIRSFTDKQELANAVRATGKKFHIELTLIDGDTVEQKNLIRQNFIQPDIGKNKARVMAERYGRAFGLEVGIVERYLNATLAEELIYKNNGSTIILGCVDNNATRKLIHENIIEPCTDRMWATHLFWIDVANEMFDGQVIIGYRHKDHVGTLGYGRDAPVKMNDRGWWENKLVKIEENHDKLGLARRGIDFPMPTFIDLFPSVLDEKPDFDPDDPSCAENAAEVEQAMATNIMSSCQLFSAFCQAMATLTDHREHGDTPNNTERRPRTYIQNFGHGGRSASVFNTWRNLTEIFIRDNGDDTG